MEPAIVDNIDWKWNSQLPGSPIWAYCTDTNHTQMTLYTMPWIITLSYTQKSFSFFFFFFQNPKTGYQFVICNL